MTRLIGYALAACTAIGFIQLPAAQADSLPTFTATFGSASLGGVDQWSISGNGFGLQGNGFGPALVAYAPEPGSSFGLAVFFDPMGLASYFGGEPGFTIGFVTINGTNDGVQLETPPEIYYSTAGVTIPYGPNPVISLPAMLTGSSIADECLGPGLVPEACGSGYYYGFLPVANINFNVPGVITFRGEYDPMQGVTFRVAQFTSLPEPLSGTMAAMGLMLLARTARMRRKQG